MVVNGNVKINRRPSEWLIIEVMESTENDWAEWTSLERSEI